MNNNRLRFVKRAYSFIRRYPIRRRLMMVYLVQIALVVLWCGFLADSGIKNRVSMVTLVNAQIVNTVTENLRGTLTSLETVTKYPVMRPNLVTTFTYDYLSNPQEYSPYEFDTDFRSQCRNLFNLYPNVKSISVFQMDGEGKTQRTDQAYRYTQNSTDYGYTAPNQARQPWFIKTAGARGVNFIWPGNELADSGMGSGAGWIYASRAILNTDRFENVGVVLAGTDISGSLELFLKARSFSSERMGIFDDEGRLLLGTLTADDFLSVREAFSRGTSQEMAFARVQTPRGSMLYTSSQRLEGYWCVVETPYRDVLFSALRQQAGFLALLVLLLSFIVFSTNLIVGSITRPIRRLESACNRLRQGQWSVHIADDAHDELAQFTHSFNDMSREIETLISEVYEKDLLSSHLEIQMLREQINPHFLYNTLESIRSAALLKGEEELGEMAFLLAKTLRYGVSQTEGTVTVRQELQNLREYMRLQKLRYKDRVDFKLNIDPAVLECRIIRLLLQPLVENALYHGINTLENGGAIDILGFCEEETLIFRVIDNGVGIREETLRQLNDYISGKNESFKSIGVRNVCRRIQLHYGEDYGVVLDASPGKGTMVTVRVPLEGEAPGEEAL